MLCKTPVLVNITSNTTFWEALTPCLSYVAVPSMNIIAAPIALIFLFMYSRIYYGSRLAFTRLLLIKISATQLNFLFSIFHAIFIIWKVDLSEFTELLWNAGINFIFSSCALLSYGICICHGISTNGFLHLSWFIRLLSLVPTLLCFSHNSHLKMSNALYIYFCITFAIYVACSFTMLLAMCHADVPSGEYEVLDSTGKEICPEGKSSSISVLFMSFATSVVLKGLKQRVECEDVWALEQHNRAELLRANFDKTGASRSDESLRMLRTFFFRLLLTIWWTQIPLLVLVLILVGFRYMAVIFLKVIVNAVQNEYQVWYPLTFLFLLFIFQLFQNVLYSKRDFISLCSYLNVRSILIVQIFNKMLRLSPAAKSRYSAGELMNIVTTDVQKIRLFWFQLRDFLYCPMMIAAALVGLFFVIGVNTVYGIVVMAVIVPINYYISSRMAHFEQVQMKYKDQRLKLVNDVLSGMRVLKLYAWEYSMQKMVAEIRAKEIAVLRKVFILDGLTTVSFQFGPIIAIFASFYGYIVVQDRKLTPEVAFISLMLFMMLRFAIYQFPQLLTNTIRALVSGRRILKFLNEEEQQLSYVFRQPPPSDKFVVKFDDCDFSWSNSTKAETPILNLRNISLHIRKGEFIGVVGRVGSGKTSLLSAILGEMTCVRRRQAAVYARTVGYVPQQTWIQNKTLRDNVLLEKDFDAQAYRTIIEACSLMDDLKLLQAGDLTEIGEKGINLSGGQKARVSLARAVYQRAEFYVLDDVLSAVDSHVGATIFDKIIGPNGLLRCATRIFALNSLAYLKYCDRIIVMHEGEIYEIGTFDILVKKTDGPFADLMREYLEKQERKKKSTLIEDEDVEDEDVAEELIYHQGVSHRRPDEKLSSSVESCFPTNGTDSSAPLLAFTYRRQMSRVSQTSLSTSRANHNGEGIVTGRPTAMDEDGGENAAAIGDSYSDGQRGRLVCEEEMAVGTVQRRVFVDYLMAFGTWMMIGFIVTLFGGSLFEAFSSVWLARWSSEKETDAWSPMANLSVYGFFGFGNFVLLGVSTVFLAIGAYYASLRFHDALVYSLLRSPISFYDRTPLGRIINRLSSDIDRIDEGLPWSLSFTFILMADAFNSLISIMMVIPMLCVVVVPLIIIFFVVSYFYNKASVQFRRLSSKTWSKCCSFVQDAYLGADSIRVYNLMSIYKDKVCAVIDANAETTYTEFSSNRWIQVRMDILTNLAIFAFVLVAILMGSVRAISVGAVALVINSCVSFSGFLGEIVRNWREIEVQAVGVERVKEYIDNEHELPWRINDDTSPIAGRAWPFAGRIEFENFCFRYRSGADLVLKNLNFVIEGGLKVGIVGRTGAGKSSITLALFRIVEPASGRILIDDVDITKIGLHDLREVLTIIPQDPVLFCGTLRNNLDPFGLYDDDTIWSVIERAHLSAFVEGFEKRLQHEIAEGGCNLSVGQRQLICLARALLRSTTKVLVLDEATAAIDPETDRLIQLSIREHFHTCTILTIAHRLNTVIDYDRILVMNAGVVAEYDTPTALMANTESMFHSLMKHAGISMDQVTAAAVASVETATVETQFARDRAGEATSLKYSAEYKEKKKIDKDGGSEGTAHANTRLLPQESTAHSDT